jgi:post-segregation antitoxin (ccd killing protein)
MNNYNEDEKISSKIFENKSNSQKVKNWVKENKEAIDLYNEKVKINGLFSDRLRNF